ncbi:hypothetical protein [Bradyrhizobium phage BDU-MI-1]|nr:hypothetical protein [Bradyrhizobium phage BDU-MI-1]
MPKYNVDKAFWHRGREVEAGETVTMTKAEAKYLGHVVSEDKPAAPVAAPEPAPAHVEVEAPEVQPLTAAVTEDKPVRHVKRHKRGAEHGGN